MKKLFVALLLIVTLTSCSKVGGVVAKAALGGIGLPTAASAQVGKTNTQTIGTSENVDFVVKDVTNSTIRPVMRPTGITTTDKVETINQINNNVPFWFIVAFILWSIFLWELPRFSTIVEYFKKGKQKQQYN
jgi:hypothetical protein